MILRHPFSAILAWPSTIHFKGREYCSSQRSHGGTLSNGRLWQTDRPTWTRLLRSMNSLAVHKIFYRRSGSYTYTARSDWSGLTVNDLTVAYSDSMHDPVILPCKHMTCGSPHGGDPTDIRKPSKHPNTCMPGWGPLMGALDPTQAPQVIFERDWSNGHQQDDHGEHEECTIDAPSTPYRCEAVLCGCFWRWVGNSCRLWTAQTV